LDAFHLIHARFQHGAALNEPFHVCVVSCRVVSCRVVSCRVVSCRVV
jgi:hypothetical protein